MDQTRNSGHDAVDSATTGGWMAALAAGAVLGLAAYKAARLREANLRGQVALITGGSRGLGLLLARELAGEGCRLAICARDAAELDTARVELENAGAEVLTVPCDVADRDAVERMVAEVTRHFGRIDVLINNAGIIQVGPVETMTVADYEQALGVMFWGVVYPTLAVLPDMRRRRSGRIVNITSIGGKVAVPHLLPYSAAKFAAVGFSEGLRPEVAQDGISVTTIVPGLMRTGSHLNAAFKGRRGGEFTWFSLGASLPFLSMDAERAARQIVRAAKRGEPERILSAPATLLATFHGVVPGLTSDVLTLVNRLMLPSSDGPGQAAARGVAVQEAMRSPVLNALTTLGRRAADRFQHFPAPAAAHANGRSGESS